MFHPVLSLWFILSLWCPSFMLKVNSEPAVLDVNEDVISPSSHIFSTPTPSNSITQSRPRNVSSTEIILIRANNLTTIYTNGSFSNDVRLVNGKPLETRSSPGLVDAGVSLLIILGSYMNQLKRHDLQGIAKAIHRHTFLTVGLPFLSGIFCGLSLILLLHLFRLCYRRLFFRRYYAEKSAFLRRKNIPGIHESRFLLKENDDESEYEVWTEFVRRKLVIFQSIKQELTILLIHFQYLTFPVLYKAHFTSFHVVADLLEIKNRTVISII